MTIQYQGVWSLQSAAQLQSTQRWVTDPLYKNTTLLLQADDAANAAQNNTFLDSSSNSFAITRNGNTTQGTFTPFSLQPGAWSNFFDGTGDYLSNTSTALITNTVSTFTVESWVYFTATPPANGNFISSFCTLDGQPTGPTNFLSFGPLNDGKLYLFWFDGSVKYASGNTVLALNTWYHIACVVNSNSIQFYVNGIPEVMGNTTTLTNRSGSQGNFAVASSSGGQITGYISNFRVTTTAVYISRFTPSTTPLTPVTGTVLLTCQSNQFIDTNTQVAAKALTVNGNSAVQAFSPFAPQYQWTSSVIGGSGYFDGTGDYLSFTGSIAISGQFSAECWFYRTATGAAQQTLFAFNSNNTSYASIRIDTDGNGNNDRNITLNISTNGTSWNTFAVNSIYWKLGWNHVVATRDGSNNVRLFLNGVLINTVSAVAGALFSTSTTHSIGCNTLPGTATNLFTGYISDVRLVNGSIPTTYQTSSTTTNAVIFTPPSAPLTATSQGATASNVTLLTNFTNAGIYDGTMKNDLETVGNAQISTAVVKYGSGTMYFDGNGDYLRFQNGPNLNFAFGTGDFTIELWIYMNTAANQTLFDIYDGNSTGRILYQITSSRTVQLAGASGANRTTTTGTMPLTTWSHIALCKASNVTRIFIDGVQANTNYTDTNNYTCTTGVVVFGINGSDLATNPLNAYIDDLRITKGFARYTQNFIPPSVALPRQ